MSSSLSPLQYPASQQTTVTLTVNDPSVNMQATSVASVSFLPTGTTTPIGWPFSGYQAPSTTSATVSVTASAGTATGSLTVTLQNGYAVHGSIQVFPPS